MTEKKALGRTLMIYREVCSAIRDGRCRSHDQILDNLAAALTHLENEKQPLAKCIGTVKSVIKRCDPELYARIKPQLSPLMPVMDYDFEPARKSVPALVSGIDKLREMLNGGEDEKARAYADALHNCPGFIFGEFPGLTAEKFEQLIFGYYRRKYET